MTRDEALQALDRIRACDLYSVVSGETSALRTYILNSIPTPKVEVVQEEPESLKCTLMVNGAEVGTWISAYIADGRFTSDLRAALGIEVKP